MKKITSEYQLVTNLVKAAGLFPVINTTQSAPTGSRIIINGKECLNFGSNNYLGLSVNPDIIKAATSSLIKYGLGSGSPRIFGGNVDVQEQLEESIASFLGSESAISFTTGYMANMGAIPALASFFKVPGISIELEKVVNKPTSIFIDERCHGSIIDGSKLAKAAIIRFTHNSIDDLYRKLANQQDDRKIIITQGVYSTEGEIAPIDKIAELAKLTNSLLMIDDADGVGVLGANRRGTIEHFNLSFDDVDLVMGSLTKAFGGLGGFIAGGKHIVEYLRISSKTYLLSAPIPPSISAGVLASIKIAQGMGDEIRSAIENAETFSNAMTKLGFRVLGNHPLIKPILIGDDVKSVSFVKILLEEGIVVPSIRFPAVPWNESRLRFTFTCSHTRNDVKKLIDVFKKMDK